MHAQTERHHGKSYTMVPVPLAERSADGHHTEMKASLDPQRKTVKPSFLTTTPRFSSSSLTRLTGKGNAIDSWHPRQFGSRGVNRRMFLCWALVDLVLT